MTVQRSLRRDERGATAAEFALVLPVALLFLLGTIDIGRYFWALNQLEKAVQAGTRYAVSTDVVASGLDAEDYTDFNCGSGGIKAGDTICREALGTIVCSMPDTTVTCTCTDSPLGAGTCPADLTTVNADAFERIVNRMNVIDGKVYTGNVQVKYSGSGIGFAGDPAVDEGDPSDKDDDTPLSDISPLVTVEVVSFTFRSFSLLGAGITLPGFRYSQTLEDGDGAIAY